MAAVAEDEFKCLASGLDEFDILERLTDGLIELQGLSVGQMPQYNPWTSLCYLTWYQPHHINLALTMLTEKTKLIQKTFGNNDGIRWIDFGCGSFPMHIALDVATAVDPVLESYRSRIHRIGIDSSEHMLSIGEQLMRTIEALEPSLTLGSKTLIAGTDLRERLQAIEESGNLPTVLSVMHVFYKENIVQVKNELAGLIASLEPKLILVMGQSSSKPLLDCVFSDHLDTYLHPQSKLYGALQQPLRLSGELAPITALRRKWRKYIRNVLLRRDGTFSEGGSTGQRNATVVHQKGVSESNTSPGSTRKVADGADLRTEGYQMAMNYLKQGVNWSGHPSAAPVEVRVYYRV